MVQHWQGLAGLVFGYDGTSSDIAGLNGVVHRSWQTAAPEVWTAMDLSVFSEA